MPPPWAPPPPVLIYMMGGQTYGNANSGYGHTDSYSVMNPLMAASGEMYTVSTDTWTTLPAPSVNFGTDGCVAAYAGSLYYTQGSNLLIFDTVTQTWSQGADMLLSRTYHGCAFVEDKLYITGGPYGQTNGNIMQEYTVSTNSWQYVASMSTYRHGLAMAVYAGELYVFGGHNNALILSAEKYSPDADSWTPIADVPHSTNGFYYGEAAVLGDHIYLAGGVICTGCNNGGTAAVVKYDPVANTYDTTVASMSIERTLFALSASPDGRLWAIGGCSSGSGIGMNTMEVYDPSTNTWDTSLATMQYPRAYTAGIVTTF